MYTLVYIYILIYQNVKIKQKKNIYIMKCNIYLQHQFLTIIYKKNVQIHLYQTSIESLFIKNYILYRKYKLRQYLNYYSYYLIFFFVFFFRKWIPITYMKTIAGEINKILSGG